MKFSLIYISFIFSITLLSAGDLENYLNYRAGMEEYTGDIKCATRYDLQIKIQSQYLDKNTQSLLKIISTEPVRSDSLRTEHFTLHWDETGVNSVPLQDISGNGIPDYIDSAAVILEHVWDVEINQMGYSPPPQQNGQPVNNYHVYFTDMAYYGITTGSGTDIPSLPGLNWTSYLELENDYQENVFNSNGLDGLKITAAHEFHHAIEFGYNIRYEDYFFYEMTATWLEDVLYNDINDYYNYINEFIGEIGLRSFDYYSGFSLYPYGNCLYNHMVTKQFGNEFIKDTWDEIRTRPVIDALRSTLANNKYNSSWLRSLNEYGVWLYYTGNRAQPTKYFPEAAFYPQIKIRSNNAYQFADSLTFNGAILANSFKYFKVLGIKDIALQCFINSELAEFAGHTLFDSKSVSDFSPMPDTLNGFISDEDSIVLVLTNADDSDDNFFVNTKILQNYVKVNSFAVQPKEGRNILSWSSSYEILNAEWILSRKLPGETFQMINSIPGREYSNRNISYNFVDTDIQYGTEVDYKLEVRFTDMSMQLIDSISTFSLAPTKFNLVQNYPNPFNNSTTIIVEITQPSEISLNIYNTLGQKIKTLQNKIIKPTGYYIYKWAGDNDNGSDVASGIYLVQLSGRNLSKEIKIVYIR